MSAVPTQRMVLPGPGDYEMSDPDSIQARLQRQVFLTPYAPATRCPVLTSFDVLPGQPSRSDSCSVSVSAPRRAWGARGREDSTCADRTGRGRGDSGCDGRDA
eukprot:208831-Rhodomonas_salina.1